MRKERAASKTAIERKKEGRGSQAKEEREKRKKDSSQGNPPRDGAEEYLALCRRQQDAGVRLRPFVVGGLPARPATLRRSGADGRRTPGGR